VEGVSEVFYLRGIARGVDGYDIEADLAEAGEAARGQNLRRCAGDAAALSRIDRLRGAAEALAAAESYLDEAEGVAVERHEV
jgi:hypothetical protein